MRTYWLTEFADNSVLQPDDDRIVVSCDGSLDEGNAVIRTEFSPAPLSSGTEFFIQIGWAEPEALLSLLDDGVALMKEGDEDREELLAVRGRVKRVIEYRNRHTDTIKAP